MRKTLELLALSTCTAALCVTLTGCEAVKGTASGEKPVKTVYVYLPDGTLLDKGRADNPQISTKGVYDRAVALAVEAIQTAAMARKFERSQRRHWPGAKDPHYGEEE